VACGATIGEKHFTYDRNAAGPDHSASADAEQFAKYVKLIRQAKVLCGSPGKHVLPVEEDVRRVSRQSLVVARDLLAGEVIGEKDLTVQRPGLGISAAEVESAMGKKVLRPVGRGDLLQWDMLAA
jgi:N,N'-diacetyllegionaminate synthase